MIAEPEIQFSGIVNATTSGVVGTTQYDVLVAAPGAGLRLRIFHVATRTPYNAAAATLALAWTSGAVNGGAFHAAAITSPAGWAWGTWYPQGIPLGVNTALNLQSTASVVSIATRSIVQYIIENV